MVARDYRADVDAAGSKMTTECAGPYANSSACTDPKKLGGDDAYTHVRQTTQRRTAPAPSAHA